MMRYDNADAPAHALAAEIERHKQTQELLDAARKTIERQEREIERLLAENVELRTKLFNAEWYARATLAAEPPGRFVEGVGE